VTGRYPTVSHTFILREAGALEARGWEVRRFAIWKSPPEQLLAQADRDEAQRTTALLPLRARLLLGALGVFARRPKTLRIAVAEARELSRAVRGPRRWLLAASWVLEGAMVVGACRRDGIRHVHAHLGGTAPSVALVTAAIGCVLDGPGAWTWSFTVHGPAEFYDVFRESLDKKVRQATFVVAISDFARSQLMTLVDEDDWEKIHVVHCGVDVARFAPPGEATAAGGPVRVLCVGRLTRIKGQAVLLEALQRLVARGIEVEATLVGDGPMRDDLERLARQMSLNGAVRFTGAIGHDEIRAHYATADVFCLSSFAEGVPVVLMEAMAMGKPVVASQVMGVSELVQDGLNGRLVPPGRADLLAEALAQLAADAQLRARMGAAGRDTILREFSLDQQGDNLQRLLERYAAQA
jgi:glycosyltransferase involved in cell wall biosynthesis